MAENTTSTIGPATQAAAEAQTQAAAAHTVTGASAELGELFGALAKAQGEVKSARASSVGVVGKDSSQTTFSYADLAEIWEACRAALSKSGLALLQRARVQNNGWVVIETILGHSSGQWIRSELPLMSCTSNGTQDMRPRTIGATISFGRRYGLAALVGVVQVDEEPDQAQQQRGWRQDQRHQQRQQQQQTKQAPAPAAKSAAKTEAKSEAPAAKTAPASTAADPPVDFDPETGVVREPAPQEVFERQLVALNACTTAPELDHWSKRIAEMQFSSEQLEQLRRALRTKRGSLAQPAA